MRTAIVASCLVVAKAILPGIHPTEYNDGDEVKLKVNKLTSAKTQLPYDFYSLPFCIPEGGPKDETHNLGEVLKGDKVQNSPYQIKVGKNSTCRVLCKVDMSQEDMGHLRNMIEDEYMINWMVDGLPAVTPMKPKDNPDAIMWMDGFPVGILNMEDGNYWLHNHVALNLSYHKSPEYEGIRVVGFEVTPYSLNTDPKKADSPLLCKEAVSGKGKKFFSVSEDGAKSVLYTYDVDWHYSDQRWVSRWDVYRRMAAGQIHWFAILNSLMIVLFLSAMVAMILLRTLHRDITNYNDMTKEEVAEETGWKLVHGDVFRKPPHFTLLAVSVGSGVQLLGMSLVTLILALVGLLTPQHRGSLLQSMLLLFTVMGSTAGFVAAKMCKLLDESASKSVSLLTALLYPGLYFSVFFCLNLLIWEEKSSGAVPFPTLLTLLVLWFGISVPLVLLGFRAGFRADPIELPVKTATIPREIPEQVWYTHPAVMCLAGGLLSFSAIFTELFFIMSSLWQHHFYYLFGFLTLVLVILIIMCSEVSIALTYFQLTAGDYRWWWQSFFASGSASLYVMVYSVIYFNSKLQIEKTIPMILYFAYMGIASTMFGLLTGSIGMLASFGFVKAIYSSVKID